jgi:hypothetical protein
MKKKLITYVTAFAIILSAGTSTAGPLRETGQRGFAHKVYSSASQTFNHAYGTANNLQSTKSSGIYFDLPSKRNKGLNNLSATLQYSAISPSWSWDFSDLDVIGTDTGGYAIEEGIRLTWGPNQEGQLPGQVEEDGRYLIGSLFLVAVGYGVIVEGYLEIAYDIFCPRGNLSPIECYAFYNWVG